MFISHTRLADETCSSRPVSGCTFDDLDQSLFNIEDTELWQSQQIGKLFTLLYKNCMYEYGKTENACFPQNCNYK
jgi:hypothetical protein